MRKKNEFTVQSNYANTLIQLNNFLAIPPYITSNYPLLPSYYQVCSARIAQLNEPFFLRIRPLRFRLSVNISIRSSKDDS